MPQIHLQRNIPYPQPFVYAIVADVERYPEFLPGFRRVRVRRDDASPWEVTQTVGWKGVTTTFVSHASFQPPEIIHIVSTDRPFRRLDQVWRFQTLTSSQTRVRLEAEYELNDRMLGGVFNTLYPTILERGLAAFQHRAVIEWAQSR